MGKIIFDFLRLDFFQITLDLAVFGVIL